ncbi:MAG TPA: hypothetical protein VII99_04210 [Bacteroidia bacterium]
MTKKIIFIFGLIGLYCMKGHCANPSTPDSVQSSNLKFEAGFDLFYFVNTFRRTFSPEVEAPILSLTLIRNVEPDIELRLITGFGKVNYSIKTDQLHPKNYNETNLSLRFGLEKEVLCGKKWMFFYGSELFVRKDLVHTVQPSGTDIDTEDQNTTSYGIAPLAGIKYFITPRILLSTEMNFYMSFFHFSDKNSFQVDTGNNSSFVNSGFTTSFYTPNDLTLLFKF